MSNEEMYAKYVEMNNKMKANCKVAAKGFIKHIDKVDFGKNLCIISGTQGKITDLITATIGDKICVSNPSALQGFNFSVFNKQNKADKKVNTPAKPMFVFPDLTDIPEAVLAVIAIKECEFLEKYLTNNGAKHKGVKLDISQAKAWGIFYNQKANAFVVKVEDTYYEINDFHKLLSKIKSEKQETGITTVYYHDVTYNVGDYSECVDATADHLENLIAFDLKYEHVEGCPWEDYVDGELDTYLEPEYNDYEREDLIDRAKYLELGSEDELEKLDNDDLIAKIIDNYKERYDNSLIDYIDDVYGTRESVPTLIEDDYLSVDWTALAEWVCDTYEVAHELGVQEQAYDEIEIDGTTIYVCW